MKSYAEYLRDFVGKTGTLSNSDQGYVFKMGKSEKATLLEVGQDYVKFSKISVGGWGWLVREHYLIPMNMLVVKIHQAP